MTVYELIQELANYRPETDVKFNVKADFDADVDVDLEGDKNQNVNVVFDDSVSSDDITDRENRLGEIIINLEY